MKKATKVLLVTAALAMGLSTPAMAANVSVTLPQFPVTLNGTNIDNSYRQYPLLVYKDITYFPMTYYDCRFLGVETEWTRENGLKIEKSSLTGAYHPQNAAAKNGKSATAQIAAGKITVNGKNINNSKETYPLLSYRNVTYFPLTWRFAVDEFGWKYNFNGKTGLTIDAGNVKTNSVTLKDARMDTWTFDFAADKNYLYYQGKQGEIYRRPLNNLTDEKQRKTLMTLEQDSYLDNRYAVGDLFEQGGKVYVKYHLGSNLMGSDMQHRLNANGSTTEILDGKYKYYDFAAFQIKSEENIHGWSDPTKLIYTDKNGSKEIGLDNYYYRSGAIDVEGNCSWGESCIAYENNQLYALAFENKKGNQSYICRVDLRTSKTTPISKYPVHADIRVKAFELANNTIYYLTNYKPDGTKDITNYLYSIDLKTGKEVYIAQVGSSDFPDYNVLYAAADSGVYYRDKSTGSLMFYNKNTGKRDVLNGGFKVNLLTAQNGYVIAGFEENPKSSCRLAVYQPTTNGYKQVYTSADCADKAIVNADGVLVYRLMGSNQLVKVQL